MAENNLGQIESNQNLNELSEIMTLWLHHTLCEVRWLAWQDFKRVRVVLRGKVVKALRLNHDWVAAWSVVFIYRCIQLDHLFLGSICQLSWSLFAKFWSTVRFSVFGLRANHRTTQGYHGGNGRRALQQISCIQDRQISLRLHSLILQPARAYSLKQLESFHCIFRQL